MSFEKISDEEIKDQHQKCAKQIRVALKQAELLELFDRGLHVSANEIGNKESVQPILFEECYVIAENQEFLDMVKQSSSVKPQLLKNETKESEGVHLFVLVHGF